MNIRTSWSRTGQFSLNTICILMMVVCLTGHSVIWAQGEENYTVTVSTSGTGSGTITSNPAGIDCGSVCSYDFHNQMMVTLEARAERGSYFTGWSGPCSGSDSACEITMESLKHVIANFSASQPEPGVCNSLNDTIGEVMNVSNISELNAAVDTINNSDGFKTVLLADGEYVLNNSNGLSIRKPHVMIRSASGNREAVVIKGQGMTGDIGYVFKIASDDVTIADLTLGEVKFHPIQIHGEADADHTIIHNVHIYDGEQQFIKGSYDHNSPEMWSDNAVVECSFFEYTARHSRQRYTGGIDTHHGVGWIVRDNEFRYIRSMTGGPTQDHTIHFWTSSADNIIERNTIVNCDRGIGFGELNGVLNSGGIIRNNMIYNDGGGMYNDVGIIVSSNPDVKIYHNTIYHNHDYPNAIEYRFADSTNADIRNNLTNKAITARDGASGTNENNVTYAQRSWFTDAAHGDLHLQYDVAAVINNGVDLAEVTTDIDLDERTPGSSDIGADEKQNAAPQTIVRVELTSDKHEILTDGRDTAAFSVTVTYDDATQADFVADYFSGLNADNESISTNENTFSTYTAGTYRFKAHVGTQESNEVVITAMNDNLSDVQPTNLQVAHRNNQTFITWKEVTDIIGQDEISYKDFFAIKNAYQRDITYKIYRSPQEITDVSTADFIGQVDSLSGWNQGYYGTKTSDIIDAAVRYTTEDLGVYVERDTGMFVHNPDQAGEYYYAVTAVVDGQENTNILPGQNSRQTPVTEAVGQGRPVLQRVHTDMTFQYVDHADVYIYTRWEDEPNTNREGTPYDYLVAIPENLQDPAPAGIHFHCWGGSMFGGFGWWWDGKEGSILISSNQDPYDWWTGYHENAWTENHPQTQAEWEAGVVRPYSASRMKSFYEWVRDDGVWNIDDSRVYTAGNSMGGAGSIMFSIRYPEFAAWNTSWVGVHVPSMSDFRGSYEKNYGSVEYHVLFEDGTPVWDYYNDVWYLRNYPKHEIGYITFSNGKNDEGIGWTQAVEFYKALQETKRPHMFVWGQAGHRQRSLMPNSHDQSVMPIDMRTDQSLPAFTNCSLDDNPGNGDPSDGDPEGQVNRWLYWETADITDTPATWEMTVALMEEAPQETASVDVTPRRLQQFALQPGVVIEWTNKDVGTEHMIESGEAIVDENGLVTLEQISVGKHKNRLSLTISDQPIPDQAAFSVNTTNASMNEILQFTDESVGDIDTWQWDFGDGNTSTEPNPAHAYAAAGDYTVSLTITTDEGKYTEIKENYIHVAATETLLADFSAAPLSGQHPLEVQFTDETTGGTVTHWEWDFDNDGTVDSTEQHPRHEYQDYGYYTVRLTVTTAGDTDSVTKTDYITVEAVPPAANFTVDTQVTNITETVHFTDQSTGDIDTWEWDFDNDGTVDSTEQHPGHNYQTAGTYTVTLTTTGPEGTDTVTKTDYIEVRIEFSFPVTVTTTGEGTGIITSSPAGIDCGSTCTYEFSEGSPVTLTAVPDAESAFSGWSGGGCSGIGICTLTMDGAKEVTAEFAIEVIPEETPTPTAVPEPSTVVLIGIGLLGMLGLLARKQRYSSPQ